MVSRVTKWCPHCEQALPLDRFRPDPRYPSGRSSWCRACMAAAQREKRKRTGDAYGKARRRAMEALKAAHRAEFEKLLDSHLRPQTKGVSDA